MGWHLYLFDVEKSDTTGNSYEEVLNLTVVDEKIY
jgi:hypothetical protein